MENKRPARKKLSMPLGGIVGRDGGASAPLWSSKTLSLLFFAVVVWFGVDWYNNKKNNTTYSEQEAIKKMTWNAKVFKKYANAQDRDDIHYILEVKDAKNGNYILDLYKEKTEFWDIISVKNTLIKAENSLNVQVKRYCCKDTILTLQFAE